MLSEFLARNQTEILALVMKKTVALSESLPSSRELEQGLPKFYGHLIGVLRRTPESSPKVEDRVSESMTSEHGKELARLGYTVSQVVHGYGAICQSITQVAQDRNVAIDSGEFNLLNYGLDVAIAEAVTGFEDVRSEVSSRNEACRIGFLVHELRNALTIAHVAYRLIREGSGLDEQHILLERSLTRMAGIIDQSSMQARLQNDLKINRLSWRIIDVVNEVKATATWMDRSKNVSLSVRVDPTLEVNADRFQLVSALTNLIQNAMKFSKSGGNVTVRSREDGKFAVIEVEDSCGGLPAGAAEDLFKPFAQRGADRTGLGLGLAISRHAISLNYGRLWVRDIPGRGCVFSARLPKPERSE
ncbi:MAG: ATP-binding protein [Elusimicrobiota bacterium]